MLIKKILIGIDNSKYAENAAKYGFDIAHKFSAKVALVHMVVPMVMPYNNTADPLTGLPTSPWPIPPALWTFKTTRQKPLLKIP
ncbi:universal stress protein [Mucilaginibacter antarcticus]|uniref:universal stress protein n=1 Tax=Mucilaginibacter antarcticus TaxID=1855725 RepID=UPI00363DAED0